MIKIYAPASIGNINVGFDILGAAVSPINGNLLGDCVTIEKSTEFNLINEGKFSKKLPKNYKNNIVWKCWKKFCKIIDKKITPISIKLEKNMPIGSGLGSSACSVVASLVAMNNFFGKPLTKLRLLSLMGEIEGSIAGSIHYDNVSPCYLGGLQLIIGQEKIISQNIPIFKEWIWVVAWPGIEISTAKARALLPNKYDKNIIVQQNKYLAGFIHASYTQQSDLAAIMMKDIIAEPYRKKLIPNFSSVKKAAKKIGAIACGISGSGPTIFTICNKINIANKMAVWLKKNYIQNEEGFVRICYLDTKGARSIGDKYETL
ncbi:Homoserine kinase [Buchnera aphidicola (Neophyllaphis podocarpi)]|uniref:homoserine kinase n=1 Tax=Buchnera aphidicola TaxID=9 RepID=UPI003464CE3C